MTWIELTPVHDRFFDGSIQVRAERVAAIFEEEDGEGVDVDVGGTYTYTVEETRAEVREAIDNAQEANDARG